jgi:hypothetical protein
MEVDYDEQVFSQKVKRAMEHVKLILDNARNPTFPEKVPHEYSDKYVLAELLTRSAMIGIKSALETIGLSPKGSLLRRSCFYALAFSRCVRCALFAVRCALRIRVCTQC